MNLPPFYVGQNVVRTVPVDGLVVGQTYVITDISWCCDKWGWRVSVYGGDNENLCCASCGKQKTQNYAAKYFAPIEENFQSITLEKVLEQETKLVSVN